MTKESKVVKHLMIPDVQAKEGVSLEHLKWIGNYIVHKKPDVIVCIGDFADMPSLSCYDKNTKKFEGRRYNIDLAAARKAMDLLLAPMKEYNSRQKANRKQQYRPRMVMTLGNHEERIARACNMQPELDGILGYHQLPYEDWEVHDFLKPVIIDGLLYVHYLANPMTGKPYAGTALSQLTKVGQSFIVGHKQVLDVATRFTLDGRQQWGIIAGACLESSHRVLTADLTYKPLKEVKVGDKIVSFDEHLNEDSKRSRRYKTGTVEAIKLVQEELFEVELENGKIFKVTSDHLWLTEKGCTTTKWTRTDNLLARDQGVCNNKFGVVACSHVMKLMNDFDPMTSFDAGWLSGMYDGEGCLYTRTTTGGIVAQLSVSQKEGKVLDRIRDLLKSLFGLDSVTETYGRAASTLRIKGGRVRIAEVLGQLRPGRLLDKFTPEHLGRVFNSESIGVKSIRPIGKGEIARIAVDHKTMVVDGYGHHNCYQHDEDYKGYQGNNHFRGVVMLHDVKDGSCDPMFVSLDFLERRYSNAQTNS